MSSTYEFCLIAANKNVTDRWMFLHVGIKVKHECVFGSSNEWIFDYFSDNNDDGFFRMVGWPWRK